MLESTRQKTWAFAKYSLPMGGDIRSMTTIGEKSKNRPNGSGTRICSSKRSMLNPLLLQMTVYRHPNRPPKRHKNQKPLLLAPPATVSSECGSSTLSKEKGPIRRSPKDFIDAAKRQRTGSYEKFAAHIGISKDTLYAITKESRWVSDANYKLVAEVCGCNPEDLRPRDVPRPERR
jgi:hypothetical protein